jgi:hypothetical protein
VASVDFEGRRALGVSELIGRDVWMIEVFEQRDSHTDCHELDSSA